ncbi:MAG: hypothetical protein KJ063_04615, partial [Anaerolineae bacterium]|nr:hypothetical protein [Anaerolineae bacterium]
MVSILRLLVCWLTGIPGGETVGLKIRTPTGLKSQANGLCIFSPDVYVRAGWRLTGIPGGETVGLKIRTPT